MAECDNTQRTESTPPACAHQVEDGGIRLVPDLAEVQDTILNTFEDIIAATAK